MLGSLLVFLFGILLPFSGESYIIAPLTYRLCVSPTQSNVRMQCCSHFHPRVAAAAQHEEQAGEQDRGHRPEENSDGDFS